MYPKRNRRVTFWAHAAHGVFPALAVRSTSASTTHFGGSWRPFRMLYERSVVYGPSMDATMPYLTVQGACGAAEPGWLLLGLRGTSPHPLPPSWHRSHPWPPPWAWTQLDPAHLDGTTLLDWAAEPSYQTQGRHSDPRVCLQEGPGVPRTTLLINWCMHLGAGPGSEQA